MSYLHRQMIDGEKIVFRARPHRITLAKPFFLACLAATFMAVAVLDGRMRAFALIALIPALAAMPAYLRYRCTEYIVTNRRLCVRTGVFRVTTLETVLGKVGAVVVEQTLPGRVLNYGNVLVKGMGGSSEPLPRIAQPYLMRRKVHEALAAS